MAERTHSVRLRLVVDQLRRDAAEASKAVAGIGSAAEDTGRQSRAMDALGNSARSVGRTAAAVGTVAAGAMAAIGVATIRTGIAYNSLEQSTRAALTTLLGSAEAATAQMDKLREFVRTALFPREVFIQGQQQLLAFGFAAESVIPTLDAVQNAVAATGGSAQVFTEVVEILAEMQSTGDITAGTLNELGRRGINAAQLIGQAMGKTENEIRESITSGALDGRDAINLLVDAMESRFAGAAALISNTWVGASGLVTAALRDIGSALVEPFIDPAGGGAAVLWAQNLAQVLYALERQIREVVGTFRTAADPAFAAFGDQLLDIADTIGQIDIGAVIDQVSGAAPALAAFGAAAATAGTNSVLAAVGMGGLAGAVNPLTAAIAAAIAVSPELRDLFMQLLEALAPLLPVVLDTALALGTALSTGLAAVATLLTPIVGLVAAVVEAFTMLPAPVQTATVGLLAFVAALRFGGPIGLAVAALAVLGATLEAFGGGMKDTRVNVAGLSEDLERLGRTGEVTADLGRLFGDGAAGVDEFADKLNVATASWHDWSDNLNRTFDEINAAKDAFKDLDAAMSQLVKGGADADEVLKAIVDTYDLTEEQVRQLMEVLPQYTAEAERQAAATEEGADAQEGFADATEEATNALREQADELQAQADPIFALIKGLGDVRDAQSDYNAAVEEFGGDSEEARDAAAALLEATIGLQGAAGDASGAFDGKLTPAMRASLEAAGATESEINAVEDALRDAREQLDGYEGRYEAELELQGAAEAEAAAKRLKRRLNDIDRFIKIQIEYGEGQRPAGGLNVFQRWGGVFSNAAGGVYTAQDGLLRSASIFTPRSPARFAFAEPATGGEAFIPRRGDRSRSLGILSTAAGWYDASVVPDETSRPGYVLAEDGSWVPRSFYGPDKVTMPKPGYVLAEDGSWVPKSFYAGSGGSSGPERRTMPKPGFLLAEDGSWVPKNFYDASATSPSATRRSMKAAAREILEHIGSGGRVSEDLTYSGAPGLVKRFNDEFADMFYGAGNKFSIAAVTRFLKSIQGGRFDSGGWLQPGWTLAENTTGRPERVVPPGSDVGGPYPWRGNGRPTGMAQVAGPPYEFRATATIDLGEGIERVVELKFERHDDELMRFVGAGTGAAR